MSNASFVRRAPEIAEEILAKTANLPKDLKSFARNLFEKEASTQTDSLKMPARMTISDLRKIAAGNKVNLPKIASVKAEEYGGVADGLRKMAERHAKETRDDVLALALTILEKGAAGAGGTVVPRVPGLMSRTWSKAMEFVPHTPERLSRIKRIEVAKGEITAERARRPLTKEYEQKRIKERISEEVAEKTQASERLHATVRGMATPAALGASAIGGGIALQPEKKTEVKAFRAIA